jgi:hypothetical protein
MANRGVLIWVFSDQNFSPILPAKKFKAMSENYQNRKWGIDANG